MHLTFDVEQFFDRLHFLSEILAAFIEQVGLCVLQIVQKKNMFMILEAQPPWPRRGWLVFMDLVDIRHH